MGKFAITRIEEFMREYDAEPTFVGRCDLAKRFRAELEYIVPELWAMEDKANGDIGESNGIGD